MVIISNTDFIAPEGQYTIDRDNDPGMFKAYIPEFLYRPPYGYPRKEDLITIRKLAKTPYVHMIIRTIAQQVASTPWDIKVKEEYSEEDADYQEKIKGVKNFFRNPNGNQESFEDLMVAWVTDVLEIDSGVGIKVFNKNGRLTQLFARDGSTFLKNPDPFGYLGSRAEIIPPLEVDLTFASPKQDNGYMIDPGTVDKQKEAKLRNFYDEYLRPKAAFFQYGWTAGAMPVPFGKREVVWFQSNTRSDTVYGRSPVEVLGDVLFTLLYGSSYSLDMFIKNNIPAGVIQLIGAQQPQINAFRERFDAEFITKDVFSNNRHNAWKAPIANQEVKFTPFNFTSKEMEVLESQKWYLKIAAAVFGVTQDELGITEDSNKAVSMTQGGVFKRKAVQPILRLMQQRLNTQVMPEFGYEALEFVFDEYDIDEDMKKHNLLEQEIRMGVKTPEMVAAELGIDVNELKAGKEEKRQQQLEEQANAGFGGGFSGFASEKSVPEHETISLERELEQAYVQYMSEELDKALGLVNELPKDQLSKISVEGKALHDAIIGKILKLFNISVLGETIAKIVQHSYVNGIDEAEKQFNRNFLPDNKAIIAAQQLTFDNIKGATEEFKDKLRGIISRGVKEGRGAGEIATQIKDQLGVTITRAKTIARTELVSAYNDGSYQGAKDSGLLLDKVWDGHLDMRTSDICRSLNGVRIPLSESFEYEGKTWLKPPAHPNCRSRLRYIVKGEQDE